METENTLGTKNLKRHWLLGCLPCKATCDRMTGDLIQVGWGGGLGGWGGVFEEVTQRN